MKKIECYYLTSTKMCLWKYKPNQHFPCEFKNCEHKISYAKGYKQNGMNDIVNVLKGF